MKRFLKITKVFFKLKGKEIKELLEEITLFDILKGIGVIILAILIVVGVAILVALVMSILGYLVNLIFNFIINNSKDYYTMLAFIGFLTTIVLGLLSVGIYFLVPWIKSNIDEAVRIVDKKRR